MAATMHEDFGFPLLTVQVMNWLLLIVMFVAFWVAVSPFFAKGVLIGGVLANASFFLLKRDLTRIMAGPLQSAKIRFFIQYYMRLSVLAVILYFLIRYHAVHVIGMVVGLSTVVLSIGFTTAGLVKKYFFVAKEA
jgi:hypothetical protein